MKDKPVPGCFWCNAHQEAERRAIELDMPSSAVHAQELLEDHLAQDHKGDPAKLALRSPTPCE